MAKPAPKDRQELQTYLLGELEDAKAADSQASADRAKADQLLVGKELGKVRKGDPAVVSTDAADAVESVLADMLEIFGGSDEPVSIKPRKTEARRGAGLHRDLIRYQTQRQLEWFKINYTALKDGLSYRKGVVQWGWDYSFTWEEREYERLTAQDLAEIMAEGGELMEPGEPWVEMGQVIGQLDCTVKAKKVLRDRPFVRPVPVGSFLVSPGADNIRDAAFVAARDYPTMYSLKQDGQALGYDLTDVKVEPISADDERAQRLAARGKEDGLAAASGDEKRGRVERWVCYFQWPGADGAMQPMTGTIVGDKLVHVAENPYERPPFETWSPILDTHMLEGRSLIDLVAEIQHIKTALYRAMLTSVAYQVGPQTEVKRGAGVNLNEILRGRPHSTFLVRENGAIRHLERPAMGREPFHMWEMIEGIKEQRVGVTRLNQGIDADSLNKTARGMMSLMAKAEKRIRLFSRLYAELFLKPLFRALIWLNQNFLDKEMVFSLTGETDTAVTPEDLGGDYDLVVNVGLGNSDRAMTVHQGQQLLQILGSLAKTPGGDRMVSPQNIYQLIRTIIENMGWQPSPYITDPDTEREQPDATGPGAPGGPAPRPGGGAGPQGQGIPGQPGLSGILGQLAGAGAPAPDGRPEGPGPGG